jgi:hypothetical protein
MRYHGNYCGPWWSAGKIQASVNDPTVEPIDEFDNSCRIHDAAYADGADLYDADSEFVTDNMLKGPKRTLAALAVGAQLAIRQTRNVFYTKKQNMTKQRLRTNNKTNPSSGKKTNKSPNLRGANSGNDSMVAAPVSIATRRTGMSASVTNLNDGIVRIRHRAFVKPITSFLSYTAEKLSCNPGLSGSFPWLGQLARKYDMYRFTSLKYSYRSVTATSTPGVVMLSFDYDAADDAPTTKSKQAQTIPNAESNSWNNVDLVVKTDNTWRFVRPGILANNLDVKTYDLGSLFYSSVYGTGVVTGELYVEYTIELKRPSDGVIDSGSQRYNTTAFSTPFASALSPSGYLPYTVTTNNQLTFLTSGEYVFTISATGTGLTTAPSTPTISTSGSGQVANVFSIVNATATVTTCRVRAENGDILSISGAGAGASLISMFIRVSVADYDTFL